MDAACWMLSCFVSFPLIRVWVFRMAGARAFSLLPDEENGWEPPGCRIDKMDEVKGKMDNMN